MAEEQNSSKSIVTGFGSGEVLDLGSPDVLHKLEEYVAYAVTNDDVQRAYDMTKLLADGMKVRYDLFQHPNQLAMSYERLLNLARGVALPRLSEDDLKAFFQKGIITALRNPDVDLLDKVNTKMAQLMFLEERDELKKKLRFELRRNYERLTNQPIRTSIGQIAPTVKEWFEIAERQGDADEPLTVRIIENKEFQQLGQSEQDIVGKTLGLDDLLSLSSNSDEGLENVMSIKDEKGQRFVLDHGEIHPADDPEADVLLREIIKRFGSKRIAQGSQVQQTEKVVPEDEDMLRYADQEKLINAAGSDIIKIVGMLGDALSKGDRDGILVPLSVLTRFGALEAAIQNGRIFGMFDSEYIIAHAEAAKVSHDLIMAFVKKNPDAPVTLAALLFWALRKATNGDESESARIGNQIGTLLSAIGRPEFALMTRFDARSSMYEWTAIGVKPDGRLEWVTPVGRR